MIDAWNIEGLKKVIVEMKNRFNLGDNANVKIYYEAGQEGFSVHRQLEKIG